MKIIRVNFFHKYLLDLLPENRTRQAMMMTTEVLVVGTFRELFILSTLNAFNETDLRVR